jgi:flagellar biosynthesis protein FliR
MAATQESANTWIVTALAVSGTLVIVADAADKKVPPVRLAIGLTTAGVLLGVLAQASPSLATGFAAVLLLSSSLLYGGHAWQTLGAVLPH